ncbi:hypothetical protein OO009_03015 [Flavobacteriaceae bacterium KMM 6897]|nr:hypothetical protein [Flavobacteriaceae bacterium KMM 6897]
MYERKKTSLVPNKNLHEGVKKLRKQLDKDMSIDIFGVSPDSPSAKELANQMNGKVQKQGLKNIASNC